MRMTDKTKTSEMWVDAYTEPEHLKATAKMAEDMGFGKAEPPPPAMHCRARMTPGGNMLCELYVGNSYRGLAATATDAKDIVQRYNDAIR